MSNIKNYELLSVRKKAFETNSSSSHSIVLDDESPLMEPVWEGLDQIYISQDEYGWGIYSSDSWEEKAGYLLTYAANYDTSYLGILKKAIEDHTGVSVSFDTDNGYIDHQSISTATGVFNRGKQGIIDFVFRTGSVLNIDNDNH